MQTGGSVAELLACWTQAQKGLGSNRSWTLSGNSLRQTVHTHHASVHQAAKLVAALLRVVRVTAGLAESNGSLPSGLWLMSPAGWLPRTTISSETLRLVIEYGLPLSFSYYEDSVLRRAQLSFLYSEFTNWHQQVHAGSETVFDWNSSTFKCGCWLTQLSITLLELLIAVCFVTLLRH